jgi:hypothetical protein
MRVRLLGLPPLCVLLFAVGCGGAAPHPIGASAGVRYEMTPFTVPAASEVFMCQYFPPSGKDVWVSNLHSSMTAGSHHLVVFRIDPMLGEPPSGQYPCDQLDMPAGVDSILFATQELETDRGMPDGVGMHLAGSAGVYFQSHYLNSTSANIHANVEFDFMPIDRAAVQKIAGEFFLSNQSLAIPPGMQTATRSCRAPFDMHLLYAQGHMHRHALSLDGEVAGQPVYHTDTWDSPVMARFPAPGLAVATGDTVRWTCTYDNQTAGTIVYGNSAATNEMCIFAGLYYPAPDGPDNTWFCFDQMP